MGVYQDWKTWMRLEYRQVIWMSKISLAELLVSGRVHSLSKRIGLGRVEYRKENTNQLFSPSCWCHAEMWGHIFHTIPFSREDRNLDILTHFLFSKFLNIQVWSSVIPTHSFEVLFRLVSLNTSSYQWLPNLHLQPRSFPKLWLAHPLSSWISPLRCPTDTANVTWVKLNSWSFLQKILYPQLSTSPRWQYHSQARNSRNSAVICHFFPHPM